MPVHSLVRVLWARAEKRTDVVALEKAAVRSYLLDRAGSESDIDDSQLTASLGAGIGNVSELCETERDGERRAHCGAHDCAGVGVDTGRYIDCDDRHSKGFDDFERAPRRPLHFGVQAGPED